VALLKERYLNNIESGQQESETSPAGKSRTFTILLAIASLALFGVVACNSGSSSSGSEKAATPQPASAASPASSTPAPKLSASELKEMQARDDYAAKLSTSLHARLPAYKNVKIYADNWAGTKAPTHGPFADIKTRTGDNLMLVFWSPDAETARGLTDFTKSRAAQDAVNDGFAEFQFVDPGTYCYAQVAPVGGIGPITCGIR
jgi:hypothetical protein